MMTPSKPPRPLTLYRRKDGLSYTYPSVMSASRDLGLSWRTLMQRARDGIAFYIDGNPLHVRFESTSES